MTTKPPSNPPKQHTHRKTAPSPALNPNGSVPVGLLPQAFLELAPDAIVVADIGGHMLLVNHQTEVLFGYSRPELLGRPVEMLLPSRLTAVHEQHRADFLAAPHTRPMGTGLELFGQRQDGSEFPVEVSLSPLQLGDDLVVMGTIRDVTRRKLLERERREQAERLLLQAQLIDAAHDAVLVRDPSSRIISWNHGAEELYGWTAADALGQVSHTLFQTRFPIRQSTLEAEFARKGRWEGELEHTRSDGTVVLVESRQVLVRDAGGNSTAILEINRDITARKRLEAAERQAAEQRQVLLETILSELPGGAYLVRGPEATLVIANHAAMGVWGATWLVGQPMANFLLSSGVSMFAETGQPLPPEELATLRVLRCGQPALQQREVVRRPDGTRLPILLSAVGIDATLLGEERVDQVTRASQLVAVGSVGPARAALVLVQDISSVQATEQLKDEFISVAAHELRTPLTAIQGFASMLEVQTALGRGAELVDWQSEAVTEIQVATARMNALVNDLLDVTRIQADRLELHLAPLELVAMVRRCLARLRLSTEQHTLTLEVKTPSPDEPVLLEADSMRLEQVLENLLGNAIKYSPDGGPITVTVHVDQEAALAKLCIRDRGIGIPVEQQGKMFQRFARASNVHDHQISGSGLGLFVCRELVERHGGHIWFHSTEGAGTTFFFTLPLLAAVAESEVLGDLDPR
jgi:PAS domain S-box-containing protein